MIKEAPAIDTAKLAVATRAADSSAAGPGLSVGHEATARTRSRSAP